MPAPKKKKTLTAAQKKGNEARIAAMKGKKKGRKQTLPPGINPATKLPHTASYRKGAA